MAYSSTNPVRKILDLGFASAGSLWTYESTHVHSVVEGANFFTGAGVGSHGSNAAGMKVGDLVAAVCVATSGTSAVTWHRVSSLSTSTGWGSLIHASISAASS
ncbi:hypothetical protein [Pseudomonas sp. Irchel 3A7]|uniref:hypothetical protein n=1 Tax=Pseudomonas sp. Irchel 3A7 TaxID=2008913 RepID=UPI000BA33C27|nr:hypothetical protein [Pseudomonas sp. Irchel 3A7]